MRYQHSFWYRASKEIFEDVLKADPDCAIAYWGIAQSLLLNPFGVPPAANLAQGLAALDKAKAMGAKTPRENEFIAALAAFYADHDKLDHRTRVQAYLKAMEALAGRYPQDDEAKIYYALALDVAASPADKSYANQLKAAAILEEIAKRKPQHPGVAHYLIHSYDYPPIAEKGLGAAKRYSAIAPAAPHAQHMPSHIFTRVGYWKESIAANAASVRAAKADKEYGDQLHGQDYMVYAYLQLAQDKNARAVVDEMATLTGFNPNAPGATFALAASPARYMVERGDWSGAAELAVRPNRFPHVMAITHFARALGAARSGKPDAAKADIAKLAELRDALREAKECLLGRASQHPASGRERLVALRARQARGRAQGDERRRRCRGQDREVTGDARPAGAGARALRLDAARARHGERGARRLRSDAEEGAQPARRRDWCRESRRDGRRCGQGAAALCRRGCARRECRSGAGRDRGGAGVHGEGELILTPLRRAPAPRRCGWRRCWRGRRRACRP